MESHLIQNLRVQTFNNAYLRVTTYFACENQEVYLTLPKNDCKSLLSIKQLQTLQTSLLDFPYLC